MRKEKLVFEQKYIRVLGILLLLFNDPIYASTILHPTLASAVFSSMFIITFVCGLLLFWIAAFQRVYRESTQVKSKALSLTKLVYIFVRKYLSNNNLKFFKSSCGYSQLSHIVYWQDNT